MIVYILSGAHDASQIYNQWEMTRWCLHIWSNVYSFPLFTHDACVWLPMCDNKIESIFFNLCFVARIVMFDWVNVTDEDYITIHMRDAANLGK